MSNIIGMPNANVASVTPELYAAAVLKSMWGNFFLRLFTQNEIRKQIEGLGMGDVVNIKYKPVLPEASVITNSASGTNVYSALNYGKMPITLDFALQSAYQYQNAQTTVNPLDYDKDGAEASGDAMSKAYEREMLRRIRTLVLPAAQVIGNVGANINLQALRNIRLQYDAMRISAGETIFIACTPIAFDQAMNIPEFVNKMNAVSDTVNIPNGAESFGVGMGLNMVFIKTYYIDRPSPTTDPIAYAFLKKSIVTPIRPIAISGTGVDIIKEYNSLAMTSTTLPVQDARLGVSILKKDEAVCGFAVTPWDISTAGVTSGISICHIRGGA